MAIKLSISNIAWDKGMDEMVYALMQKYGFDGLEIAPTRIFQENPYDHLNEAGQWADELNKNYGFRISSMQSIWYGRTERIFGSEKERKILLAYTKKAIDFAERIGCYNMVFGCPRNRNIREGEEKTIAIPFFKELGNYAAAHNTVLAMEANPPIYNTNYVNDTVAALALVKEVNSEGFLLNLDVGTMIQNDESVSELEENVRYINHVHVSEPGLLLIKKRKLHRKLRDLLYTNGYGRYVSVEMGKSEEITKIERTMSYVRELFEYGKFCE